MKVRIISAVVALAIVIPFIYFGKWVFAIGVGLVGVIGLKEMLDLKISHKKIPWQIIVLSYIAFLLLVYTHFDGLELTYGVTYARLVFLSMALLTPTIFFKSENYSTRDAFYLIGFILFLSVALNSIILVRNNGIKLFLFLVTIPVCTDTFAMIIGNLIGKHKMCPKISPKKSWEGCIAGMVAGTIIPCLFYSFVISPLNFKIILGTILLSCMGQIGDLVFSKIKRENEIKDFSNIMPGHGGILDRLDSTLIIFMSFVFLSILFV